MIKRFISIFLGFSLMFVLGINSNLNNIHKEVIQTKAANETTVKFDFSKQGYKNEQVVTSISIDENTSATFTKGGNNDPKYYTNGTNLRIYKNGGTATIKISTGNITKIVFEGSLFLSTTVGKFESGTWTPNTQETTEYQSVTFTSSNTTKIKTISVSYELSRDPSVTINGESTIDIFKGDTNSTGASFLVKNIDNVTASSWSFTFDEDDVTAKTESSYVTVSGSTLTNNIGTLTINALKVGTTKINVSVAGTACTTALTVNVKAKPASINVVHGDLKDNKIEIQTSKSKQISTFKGLDTDNNEITYEVDDLTYSIDEGGAYVSVSKAATFTIKGSNVGTAKITFSVTKLPDVKTTIEVNVLNDYLVSVSKITFADNLESEANEHPLESIFLTRTGKTYFGESQDIPTTYFTFSYENDKESATAIEEFIYDINKGVEDSNGNKTQTVYVFCSLDNDVTKSYPYTITIKDKPITSLVVDGKEVATETEFTLDIERNTTKQLDVKVSPDDTTLDKTIEYSIDDATEGKISVSETGIITVGNVLEELAATVTAKSKANPDIYVTFDINAVLEDMTVTIKEDVTWTKVTKASELTIGSEIIIVYENGDTKKELTEIDTTKDGIGVASDYVNGTPSYGYILTIGQGNETSNYSLKNGSKYLSCSKDKSLNVSTNVTNNSSWIFSDDAENSTVTISNVSYKNLQYNAQSPRFCCYSSSQNSVQIYKRTGGTSTITVGADLVTAIETFMSTENFQCDPNGVTFDETAWANNGMFTDAIKTTYKLANIEASQSGNNEVEVFLYNYDLVISKMKSGVQAYANAEDFLARFSEGGINYNAGINPNGLLKVKDNNNVTLIVILTSFVGLTSLGGFFFSRKRQYN